jgi:hypothetical protein
MQRVGRMRSVVNTATVARQRLLWLLNPYVIPRNDKYVTYCNNTVPDMLHAALLWQHVHAHTVNFTWSADNNALKPQHVLRLI